MTSPKPNLFAARPPKVVQLKPFPWRYHILREKFDSSLIESEGVAKETDIFG
jgi:hypothetical protein